jgi:hypothetical protein
LGEAFPNAIAAFFLPWHVKLKKLIAAPAERIIFLSSLQDTHRVGCENPAAMPLSAANICPEYVILKAVGHNCLSVVLLAPAYDAAYIC